MKLVADKFIGCGGIVPLILKLCTWWRGRWSSSGIGWFTPRMYPGTHWI